MRIAKRKIKSRHGHCVNYSVSSTWSSWKSLKVRCLQPSNNRYSFYGGRGIKVCERWLVFENFLADMGERPAGTTIERVNNNGDYEPANCRWATPKEQANNRRHSGPNPRQWLILYGVGMTLVEWSELSGIHRDTLCYRLTHWPLELVLSSRYAYRTT